PLNAIMGYAELLLEECDGRAADLLRADLERLLSEASRLLGDVDRIVTFWSRSAIALPPSEEASADGAVARLLGAVAPLERAPAASEIGRILVVDDNESNLGLLSRRLSRDGHAVAVASSGRQALSILQADDFDVVLLDLM